MIGVPRIPQPNEKKSAIDDVEKLSDIDEQTRRLVVESLNISTEVFAEADVPVYSGESSQAYTILATGILEARSAGMEYQMAKDLAVRALKIAKDSFPASQVKTYSGESSLAHALLGKSILERLLREDKEH